MTTLSMRLNPKQLTPAWHSFQKALPTRITPIRNETQYKKMVALLNALVDIVGDNENHPLSDFLDLVAQLIEIYEDHHHTIPEAAPHAVLQFLMEQHGLKQVDLAKEVGGQSIVSAILKGKREINARQAKALAIRFGVSPAVFL